MWVVATLGLFYEVGHIEVILATLPYVSSLRGLSYLDLARVNSTTNTVGLCDSLRLYEATLLSELPSQLGVDC